MDQKGTNQSFLKVLACNTLSFFTVVLLAATSVFASGKIVAPKANDGSVRDMKRKTVRKAIKPIEVEKSSEAAQTDRGDKAGINVSCVIACSLKPTDKGVNNKTVEQATPGL